MISGMDKSRLKILAACGEFMNTTQIAEIVGVHRKTVSQYLCELGDYVIRDKSAFPWRYKRNPAKEYVAGALTIPDRSDDKTAPILPQGPLSFLRECERYEVPKGRQIKERDPSWANRIDQPHIGNGSCALMEAQ